MQENVIEAERRIEEARRTGAEALDLGDLALSELPESLGTLGELRALYLGKIKPNADGRLEWDSEREAPAFTDLTPLSSLQGLQSLDLTRTGVTDLSPLSSLQGLQSLDLSYTGVTDLSPLSSLQGLQSLDLSHTGVTDLSPLSSLHVLQSLDLSGTGVTDLSPLWLLQGLQSLNLSRTGVTDLSPLSSLHVLQSLDLSGTGVTDLSPLWLLQGLQSVNLWDTGVRDLSPLSSLQGLQSLNLQSTGVTDLSPLSSLQGLQSLDLWNTGVTDLSPLSSLQGLQSLDLASTGVTDLSPLSSLQGLQNLDLTNTRANNLSPLSRMKNLQRLNLSWEVLADLSPLSLLKGLQSLNLSWAIGATDLSPLSSLQGLQSLNLWNTGVTDLSPLSNLRSLELLKARGCSLSALALRQVLDFPALHYFEADTAFGLPKEILSHGYGDNCLPRLKTYFAELALEAEAENEIKVILLGNGRVGKTQLCRRFRDEEFDENEPSTHGVKLWRKELRVGGGQEQTFQINWWDFGGQDIYHGTHALLLRSRAVFLILWSPHLENREEFAENGIPLRNQPLQYWLDYVRSLAGVTSPVIVVQSQCDDYSDRRSDPARPEGLEFFECCAYSAKTERGRETLESHLQDAIRFLLKRNGALEIGKGRAEVRRRLYEWRSEDQNRLPEERLHRTLALEEFQSLCSEEKGIVSWEHALDYFHQTGVCFYEPNLFSQRIVLDQTWALDAVYTVFHRGRTAPWLRDSGRFTREDLATLAWQNNSLEEQRLFLGLMESCGVCFRYGTTAAGEHRYIAPDLLPPFESVANRLYAWNDDTEMPILRLEYQFFHPAIIRDLMSQIGQQAGDLAEYWKYGLWLKDGRTGSQLMVQFIDTSTRQAPGAGVLELRAQGRDPLKLLWETRRLLRYRRIGERPRETLTLDGVTVAKDANRTADGRMLAINGELVGAGPFAAFFEIQKYEPMPDEEKTEDLPIKPQRLTEDEKPKEVFISYAWGDDKSPAGIERAKAADALYEALKRDGFRPIRDSKASQTGELISSFIRSLTHGDLVVAIISDKYLRSFYCMSEIHAFWQKSLEEPELMAQRLIPIILPDAQLRGLKDRAPYIRYWKEQEAELEALSAELGTDLAPSSMREIRLVRSFRKDVDAILGYVQDVLMPRNLEEHLDNGFEAVLQALRRRIQK